MSKAIRRAEQILGYGITDTAGKRTYSIIDNVVYTDLFEGEAPEGFSKAFNGRTGTNYFNELILDKPRRGTVDLILDWGSCEFMEEIEDLLQLLSEPTSLDDAGVSSKKIEDFSVSFRTADEKQADINAILNSDYGYYIRKPMIIDIASEQKDAGQYF